MRWLWIRAAGLAFVLAACSGDTSGGRGSGSPPSAGDSRAVAGSAAPTTSQAGFGNAAMSMPMTSGPRNPTQSDAGPQGDGGVSCNDAGFCIASTPDSKDCGTLSFQPDVQVTRVPGNLLIIFDQSKSMDEAWGQTTKLDAARSALANAIMTLQDDLTVGAIFFPTTACPPFTPFDTPQANTVAPIDAAEQISFRPGRDFLQAWSDHWAALSATILGTPMNEAFDRADVALKAAGLTGSTAIVAVTDGEPNCLPVDAATNGIPTLTEPMRAADWLATSGIKTYMVGLPGASGVQILNDIAQSGGTMQYIVPDDAMQLEMTLQQVVQEQVKSGFNSCSMKINPVPALPDDLLMIVDEPGVGEQQVPRSEGWSLSVDNGEADVEITGPLCDAAMSGRFTSISFKYACPTEPPPPPLPPIK